MCHAHGGRTLQVGLTENTKTTILFFIWVVALVFVTTPVASQTETDRAAIAPNPKLVVGTMDTGADQRTNTVVSNVELVLVPVSVSDSKGRAILGLNKESFQVFDDKQLQSIEQFSGEDVPVSLVVILDASGSMASSNKLQRARNAIVEFLKTSNPQDEVSLITVADEAELRADFTNSLGTLQRELSSVVAQGRTALLDGICLAVHQFIQAKYSRRALLIISDGGDNYSRHSEHDVKDLIKQSDLIIYTIGVYNEAFLSEEERLGPSLLSRMSKMTGGRSFSLKHPDDMNRAAGEISLQLRNQYVLCYHPPSLSHDGKWHNIRVKVLPPKELSHLRVSAKKGYYASAQ